MSAHSALYAAVDAALAAHPTMGIVVNGVFGTVPARGVRPYAVIEDAILADWSTKDMIGREGRLAVGIFDAGDDRARLRAIADEAVAAVTALPRELAEGWRIASLAFVRSRVFREGPGQSAAIVEFRVRMLQAN